MTTGPPLLRNGAMIAGGSAYTLSELEGLAALPEHSTGYMWLDDLCRLQPGAMWTIAAPVGIGATALALRLAVACSRSASVLTVNSHISTDRFRDRLHTAFRAVDTGNPDNLRVASWIGFPEFADEVDTWDMLRHDVIVVDTIDEQYSTDRGPRAGIDWLSEMRCLQEIARFRNITFVLVARVARQGGDGLSGFEHQWRRHPLQSAFDEVADTRIELWADRHSEVAARAYARGIGWATAIGALGGDGLMHLGPRSRPLSL